jgi:hypothetical protein
MQPLGQHLGYVTCFMGPPGINLPLTLSRRVAIVARWPLGIGLTSWRYMWRTTPLQRHEEIDAGDEHLGPALPPDLAADGIQSQSKGVGLLYHRCYRTRIHGSRLGPEELIRRISVEPNSVAPTDFARFIKLNERGGALAVGDELLVRMPGPWDGPVRVVDVSPASFRFATLDGHLEAGQIEFRAYEDGSLVFEIESWARSGDRLSSLLFNRLRMAKEVQLHMWISVLERAVRLTHGRRAGRIVVDTRRTEDYG